jgi:4-oxalocrotonate tautomerase
MAVLSSGDEWISVAIEEIEPEDWVEQVYKPDIQRNWDNLYKKPGYDASDL